MLSDEEKEHYMENIRRRKNYLSTLEGLIAVIGLYVTCFSIVMQGEKIVNIKITVAYAKSRRLFL